MSQRWVRRGAPFFAIAMSFALVAAACGDDSGSSSATTGGGAATTGGGAATTGASAATTAASSESALGTPNPATGTPVTIGLISASASDNPLSAQFKKVEEGANAAVEYANQYKGGLAGHKVDLFICQGGETPSGSQDCANQMVNKGVVAVVMPFTANGASMVPVITAAGIPFVETSGAGAEELTTPGAFMLTGGFPAALAGYALVAQETGVKKFTILATDGPGVIDAVKGLGTLVFKNAGVAFDATPVPLGTADMTPQLQAAVDGGADAIAMVGDVGFCTTWLQGIQTLALTQTRFVISTCVDPTVISAYGDVLNGSVMAGSAADPGDPDTVLYGAMTKELMSSGVDPDPTVSTGQAAGVMPILSFLNAMDGLTGDVTAATVLKQMQTAANVPLFLGLGATFTCNGTAIPLLKNVCSAQVQIGTLDAKGAVTNAKTYDVSPLFKVG